MLCATLLAIINAILAYQYENYQAELQSAVQQPQPTVSYGDTSDGYIPAGSISIPRGVYRQSQTNGGYQAQSSVYSKLGADSYTASIRGSQRNIKVIDVPSTYSLPAETMTIQIPPSSQPLTFILQSRSSELNLQSSHKSDPGSYKETNSEDGLHVLVHTVTRPVLQEIREIITPYRRVTQEIKPVQETAETLVAQDKRGYSNNAESSPVQPAKPKQQQQQPTALAQKPLKLAPSPKPQPKSQSQQQNYSQIQQKSMKPLAKQQPINRPNPPAPAAQKPKTY